MRKTNILIAIVFVMLVGVWIIPYGVFAQQTPGGQRIADQLSDYERLKDCTKIKQDPPKICLQVPFGGKTDVTGIAEYINLFYRFFVGIVVTFAIFMIVVNGFKWLFSRGNSGIVDSARKGIGSAIGAVALVFVSVAMLRIINPDLISLEVPGLQKPVTKVAGVEWCHQVPDNMTFVYKATGDIQETGTKGSDLSCGEEYEFFDSNDPKKTRHQCTGSLCPRGSHCNKEAKECSPVSISGIVSVTKDPNNPADNPFPVRLSLVPVCILDGTTYKMLTGFVYPFSDEGRFSTFVGEYQYFVPSNEYRQRDFYSECLGGTSASTYERKFALEVAIRDDKGAFFSDDFLLKRGCTEPISIQPPSKYDQAAWLFASSHLYTENEFREDIICSLTINRSLFPRR